MDKCALSPHTYRVPGRRQSYTQKVHVSTFALGSKGRVHDHGVTTWKPTPPVSTTNRVFRGGMQQESNGKTNH